MSKGKKNSKQFTLQRYALTGAAIGLYFGMFFRPSREPSVVIAVGLAAVVTVVLAVIGLFRAPRPSVGALLKQAGLNFAKYLLILLVFEARHWAYGLGGRVGTAVLTTAAGALFGLWFAYEQQMKDKQGGKSL